MPKTFTQIPLTRPATPLLDTLTSPAELRRLPATRLEQVVDELREYLLYAVGQCGGHFGAGLGVVELTVALGAALASIKGLIPREKSSCCGFQNHYIPFST